MARMVEIVADAIEVRTESMLGMLREIVIRGDQEEATEQDKNLAEALTAVLRVVAKYQEVNEIDLASSDPTEVEHDMVQLVAFSLPVSLAGARARTAVKYFSGRGTKEGAEVVLKEKSRMEGDGVKFIESHAKYLKEKVKGGYEMKAAETELEAETLTHVVNTADSICQVLKRVHDRQMREYTMAR